MSTSKSKRLNEYTYSTNNKKPISLKKPVDTKDTKDKSSKSKSKQSKETEQKLFSKKKGDLSLSNVSNKDKDLNESGKDSIENISSKKSINLEEINKEESERNLYLKAKLGSLGLSDKLNKGVVKGLKKTQGEIKDDIRNNKLNITNTVTNVSQLMQNDQITKSLNVSSGNTQNVSSIFLTNCKATDKQNIKELKSLKQQEEKVKLDIAKLEMHKTILEEGAPLKDDIIEINIRKKDLKTINNKKEMLLQKLENISKQVDKIVELNGKDKNLTRSEKIANYLIGADERQSIFNKVLENYEKEENLNRAKFQQDKTISYQKRVKEIEIKEKNDMDKKKKLLDDIKNREKEIFKRRKKEIDIKLEKTKVHIKDKINKNEQDYLYFQKKQKYEEDEKKLRDKVNLQKKDNLVTKEEILDLQKRRSEHQKMLQEEEKEKKKQLHEMWENRSQILPMYKNPILSRVEEEHQRNLEEEKKKLELKEIMIKDRNDFKPPGVKVNKRLKQLREARNLKENRQSVKITEEINKKRIINSYKVPKIVPKKKENNNNNDSNNNILNVSYDDNNSNNNNYNDIEKLLFKKPKKMLKPIQILHPKPEKPIDYLTELRKKRSNSTKGTNTGNIAGSGIANRYQLKIELGDDNKNGGSNDNLIENFALAKLKTEAFDRKLNQKKEFLKISGGYAKNPSLGDEMGDMLIQSIQAKLKIMNKLNSSS